MADDQVAGAEDTGAFDARQAAAELSARRKPDSAPAEPGPEPSDLAAKQPIDEIKFQDGDKYASMGPREAARHLAEYRAQLAADLGIADEVAPAEQQAAPVEQPKPAQDQGAPRAAAETLARIAELVASDNPADRVTAVELVGQVAKQTSAEALTFKHQTAQAFGAELQNLQRVVAANLISEYGSVDPAVLAQQDPAAFAKLQKMAATYQGLQQQLDAQRSASQQLTAQGRAQWAEQQDLAFSKAVPEASDRAFQAALPEVLTKEYGFDAKELQAAYHGQQDINIRDARVQRVLYAAVRFHQMMNASKTIRAKPLPPVQRPGVSGAYAPGEINSDVKSLNGRLSQSGRLKDAAALLVARRAARSR